MSCPHDQIAVDWTKPLAPPLGSRALVMLSAVCLGCGVAGWTFPCGPVGSSYRVNPDRTASRPPIEERLKAIEAQLDAFDAEMARARGEVS